MGEWGIVESAEMQGLPHLTETAQRYVIYTYRLRNVSTKQP